jgi:hypothetical protein
MNRRHFIQETSSALALLSCFPGDLSAIARFKDPAKLEQRSLGKTGERLSILGFGGIVVMNATPREASQRVAEAIDAGINYFDVAPSYGNAEERLGPALEPYRKKVFLACKQPSVVKRGPQQVERSLRKCGPDHFDLPASRGDSSGRVDDLQLNGALEAFRGAQQAAKSASWDSPPIRRSSLASWSVSISAILFPSTLRPGMPATLVPRFSPRPVKTDGHSRLEPWPGGATERREKRYPKCWYEPLDVLSEAMLGLRFTLSHPVTAAIPPGDENLFRMALGLAADFAP